MRVRTIAEAAVERTVQGELLVSTSGQGLYDITAPAVSWLSEIKAETGLFTAFVRHTTAGLTIQENTDPDVGRDLTDALDRVAPTHHPYRHSDEGKDDMPSHIKASMMGSSVSIPVHNRRACFGTWQAIYLSEHRDAPHQRTILLSFAGTISQP